jgi:hypothetical protein
MRPGAQGARRANTGGYATDEQRRAGMQRRPDVTGDFGDRHRSSSPTAVRVRIEAQSVLT